MSNLVVVALCLLIGLLLQRNRQLPSDLPASLNSYVIYVALPALILVAIPSLHLDSDALLPVGFAWLVMTASAVFIWRLAVYFQWPREVMGALLLTVPLGNTSFVGFPLIEALLGKEAIPYAILYDQLGSFIALSTYGSFIAAYFGGTTTSWSALFKIILRFPPFIALICALLFSWWTYPDWLARALTQISATLVPVVMVAVGLQWKLRIARADVAPLLIGLVTLLVLTPLLAWSLLYGFNLHHLPAQVIVLEAAMPAMISAGVLAANANLAPRLSSSIVGYSLLLSLFTVWAWRQFI